MNETERTMFSTMIDGLDDADAVWAHRVISRRARAAYGRMESYQRNYSAGVAASRSYATSAAANGEDVSALSETAA